MAEIQWVPIKSLLPAQVTEHLHLGSIAIIAFPSRGDGTPVVLPRGKGPNWLNSMSGYYSQFYAVSTGPQKVEATFFVDCTDEPKQFEISYALFVQLAELEAIKGEIITSCDSDLLDPIRTEASAIIAGAVEGFGSDKRTEAQKRATLAIKNLSGVAGGERSFLNGLIRLLSVTVNVKQDARRWEHLGKLEGVKNEKELIEERRKAFERMIPASIRFREIIVDRLARDPSSIREIHHELMQNEKELDARQQAMLVAVLEAMKNRDDISGIEIGEIIRPLLATSPSVTAATPPKHGPGQIPDQSGSDMEWRDKKGV